MSKGDVSQVGGKGANLGELTCAGFPVPPGFVVTAAAYLQALDDAGARHQLGSRVEGLDVDDPAALARAAADCQAAVRSAGMPTTVRRAVLDAYRQLGGATGQDETVAVRSSATAEDTASTSFAGMNETFTNVRGPDQLVDRIVDCWASLWSPGSSPTAPPSGSTTNPPSPSSCSAWSTPTSGVMFTADPASGDRARVVIEAAYGLGEVVVGGQVEPDTYVVSKDGPRILEERIGTKATKIVRGTDGRDLRVPVAPGDQARCVLDERALMALAHTAIEVERHYGAPRTWSSRWTTTTSGSSSRGPSPPWTARPPATPSRCRGRCWSPGSPPPPVSRRASCASSAHRPTAASCSPARCWWRR